MPPPLPPFTRRRALLALSAATTSAAGCAPLVHRPLPPPRPVRGVPSLAALPEAPECFPLGVMAGDALPDRAIVWTRYRYTGRGTLGVRVFELPADVRDEVAAAATGPLAPRLVYDDAVTATPEGFAHVEVTGLRPGARHAYAFVIRGPSGGVIARSPLGRFRTALDPDSLEPVVFAGTSCTHMVAAPFPVLAHAASDAAPEFDFFVHSGDHAYCDGARTLDEYRVKYHDTWSTAGMRALHAACGLYATWDDHEVTNNFDPEHTPPARVAAARRAYFEHHAQRRDPEDPARIWRRARWGRAVELFVLDSRGERRPSTRRTPEAQYLSPRQLAWLMDGLASSPAVFKLVVNSVPITDFPGVWDVAAADRWEGYRAQREALLSHIAARGMSDQVVFLSGDFHIACVARVSPPGGPYHAMREVLLGPGGQLANPLFATLAGPQWEYASGANNYTVFRADPRARTLSVAFVNARGDTLFARRYRAAGGGAAT